MLKKLSKTVLCAGLACVMLAAVEYANPTYELQQEYGEVRFMPFVEDNPIGRNDQE